MKKIVKANNQTYTREEFQSALTVVIGNRILKPKVTANSYCITIEYNIKNGRKLGAITASNFKSEYAEF